MGKKVKDKPAAQPEANRVQHIVDRLIELDEARDEAIKTETQLKVERKTLRDVGRDDPGYLTKIARWGEIERDELPACRAAMSDLALQMQKEIKKLRGLEVQESLPFPHPDPKDTIAYGRHVMSLAGTKKGKAGEEVESEDEDDDRPVGHAEPKAADGTPQWWRTSLRDIGLPDRAVAALVSSEIHVLGDIASGKAGKLSSYKGITPADEQYVDTLIVALKDGKSLEDAILAGEAPRRKKAKA